MQNQDGGQYPKRLAVSYLASLVFHALLAALLFSVVADSSQRGATERISGAEVISILRAAPITPVAVAKASLPKPSAPRIAPLQRAPLAPPAHQPRPPQRHVLSQFAPTAPPNPSPIPQASLQPAPQPTMPIFEARPENAIAAVPVPIPSSAVITIARRALPTAAPAPKPTQAPSAKPATPVPLPTRAPATAAPAPSARPSPAPSASPQVAPKRAATPAPHVGVPSPSPTHAPIVARAAGPAPSPGPKRGRVPGPHAGASTRVVTAPARPFKVRPTAPPARHAPTHGGIDINARLRAMLPHNAVNPTMKTYAQSVSLRGKINPTPPPEVLAKTKYLLDESGAGNERSVKMWVTSVRHRGPLTLCTGWLVRYPHVVRSGVNPNQVMSVTIGGGGVKRPYSGMGEGLAPIVEADATSICSLRELTPFSPASASP